MFVGGSSPTSYSRSRLVYCAMVYAASVRHRRMIHCASVGVTYATDTDTADTVVVGGRRRVRLRGVIV